MPDGVPRRARKGTKSCTECRRRKVACTWSDGPTTRCRRCEERGSACTAQVFSSPSSSRRRVSTRDRIALLEQRITTLTTSVQTLGSQHSSHSTSPRASLAGAESGQSGSDWDTDECDGSDVPVIEPPAYLKSLFNNDLISSGLDLGDANELRTSKAVDQVSRSARTILQALIPSKDDVQIFARHASGWMDLIHSIFPLLLFTKSGSEVLSQYEDMKRPNVDPIKLASWLLLVAVTAEQMPGAIASQEFTSKWPNGFRYADAVADAVDRTILAQERLSGTLRGIETSILLIRLHFARGNFVKAWLGLRRALALAELLGLPRLEEGHPAKLWECLCTMEKLKSMMFAFPSTTKYHRRRPALKPSTPYVTRLANIAIELEDIDDLTNAQLYQKATELDGNLRDLVLATPGVWEQREASLPSLLMQHLHTYICLRVHLPLSLRQVSEETSASRAACAQACVGLVPKYVAISSSLPRALPRRFLDLQAFTAAVVLLLVSFSSSAPSLQTAKTLARDVCEAMQPVIFQPNSAYAVHATRTIRALVELLDLDTDASISLKIPLLGKVVVRRARHVSEDTNIPDLADTSLSPSFAEPLTGPLSWSIENSAQIYEDFMAPIGLDSTGFNFFVEEFLS